MRSEGYSPDAADLILASWRGSTQRAYATYISKWKQFALSQNFDPDLPSPPRVANFLAHLFQEGASYSAINTARSALSAYLPLVNNCTVGNHPSVCKLVKGVFEKRPALPKYADTWDVKDVLKYLKLCVPLEKLSLKEITLKTCTLLSLVTGQRGQAIHSLACSDLRFSDSKCIIQYSAKHKTTKPGFHTAPCELLVYSDPDLCPVRTLQHYLQRTKPLRKGHQLFNSYEKPHGPVTRQTFARWVKTVLELSGIEQYAPHSARAASCSAANNKGLPLENILKAAGWASSRTFARFYKRDLSADTQNFGQSVLDSFVCSNKS